LSAETDRDAEDARRARAGDAAAVEALVRRWQGPLLNLAWRFCRDRTLAEDMVQEAFLRIHRKLDHFDGRSRFSSWLFTVATRVFISEARRVRPGWLFAEEEVLARTAGPEKDPDSGMRDELVRRAVLALPEKYRDAVTLYYFHEQDVEEAARSLGIATGTLKSRLHRGRALLERRLARSLGPATAPGEA
jgi:RNA polymerase sigma-70 factor (ECF subfamily)